MQEDEKIKCLILEGKSKTVCATNMILYGKFKRPKLLEVSALATGQIQN